VGLYSGGLIFGGAYIWNEVSVSTCGGLIHGGLIFGGGAYIRRFTVTALKLAHSLTHAKKLSLIKVETLHGKFQKL
jgi:hypothetical protein